MQYIIIFETKTYTSDMLHNSPRQTFSFFTYAKRKNTVFPTTPPPPVINEHPPP